MAREATRRLMLMVEDGVLDANSVLLAALNYLSDDEVADMAELNEFFESKAERPDPVWEHPVRYHYI